MTNLPRQLGPRGGSVEHGRRRVSEQPFRHHIVGLDGGIDVLAMNANGDSHEHVLRPLDYLAVNLQQVAALQSLEPEVLEMGRRF